MVKTAPANTTKPPASVGVRRVKSRSNAANPRARSADNTRRKPRVLAKPLTDDQSARAASVYRFACSEVRSFMRRKGLPNRFYADVLSLSMVAVMKAAERFDPQMGGKFCPYARQAIQWEIGKYFQLRTNRKNRLPFQYPKHAAGENEDPYESTIAGNASPDSEEDRRAILLHEAIGKLERKHQQVVVGRRLEGKTLADLSREIGISKQSIREIEPLAMAELKRHLEDDGFFDE